LWAALNIEPFLLAKDSANQPTAFELDLIDGGVRYVYGFSATQEKIIDEWLYQYTNILTVFVKKSNLFR
jgi:hypothetical protein